MAGKERSHWMKATNSGNPCKEAKEERGEEIRWGEFGPSDLDTWTVQIETEGRNQGLQGNQIGESCRGNAMRSQHRNRRFKQRVIRGSCKGNPMRLRDRGFHIEDNRNWAFGPGLFNQPIKIFNT